MFRVTMTDERGDRIVSHPVDTFDEADQAAREGAARYGGTYTVEKSFPHSSGGVWWQTVAAKASRSPSW